MRSPATECNDAGCKSDVSIFTGSLLEIVIYLPLGVRFTLNKLVFTGDHPLTMGCDLEGLSGDVAVLESSSGCTMTLVALTTPLSLNDSPLEKLNDFDGSISADSAVGEGYVLTNGLGAMRCKFECLREPVVDELLLLLPPRLTEDHALGALLAGGRFSYIG